MLTHLPASAGSRRTTRSGTAAVEFAVVLPFIVSMLLGVWEVGHLIEVQQVIANSAREGAHAAALGQLNTTQVKSIVTKYLTAAGLPTTNANVVIKNKGFTGNPTPPDDDPLNATQLDELQITVTLPFDDVRWIVFSYFTSPNTTLTGQAHWSSLKDKAYPSVDYPPAQ